MNTTVKKIDDFGRVALPKELRKQMLLFGGDSLEITYDDDKIILRKYQPDFTRELLGIKENLIGWAEENCEQVPESVLDAFAELINQVKDLTF